MKTTPLTFQFEVIKPTSWDSTKHHRAINHFMSYNINQLFSNESNRELIAMQQRFKSLLDKDPIQLKFHLQETYLSCLNGLGVNDWRTLMYFELSNNIWFLEGCLGNDYFE
jgi:hypothetical protein